MNMQSFQSLVYLSHEFCDKDKYFLCFSLSGRPTRSSALNAQSRSHMTERRPERSANGDILDQALKYRFYSLCLMVKMLKYI